MKNDPQPARRLPLRLAQLSWGWITPGTGTDLRLRQEAGFLDFWRRWRLRPECRFAFSHCGWYLDSAMPEALRDVTANNPDISRRSHPVAPQLARLWKKALAQRQLEFVLYPYAACVVGAMEGEALLRSLRFSQEAVWKSLGVRKCGLLVHDAPYGLNWGTEQLPQIADLLNIPFLVAGKCALVRALDGSVIPCVGSDRTLLGTIRDLANSELPEARVHPQILEMHDHLRFLQGMLDGSHPLLKQQSLDLRSHSLESILRRRPGLRLPATDLGNKGWFGGLMDGLAIEQHVFQTQQMLLALECLQTIGGRHVLADSQLHLWWKQSLLLADNHILWRCHDYKSHYLPRARDMQEHVRAIFPPSYREVFNPLSWKRSAVLWPETGDEPCLPCRVNGVAGWGQAKTAPLPAARLRKLTRREVLPGPGQCRVDHRGALWFGPARAGLQILDQREGGACFKLGNNGEAAAFTGTMALEWEWDLSRHPHATYAYRIECGEIRGDAYLLECDYHDLSGRVRERTLHPLRTLGWEGGSLPRRVSRPHPVDLDLRYYPKAVIRIYVACEGEVGIRNLRAVPLRGSLQTPFQPLRLRAVPLTACEYRPLKLDSAQFRRRGGDACEARFAIGEADFGGQVLIRAEKDSELVQVRCDLEFAKAVPFGWPTAPLAAQEGSFLGAGCERPYLPGLLFEIEAGNRARFSADRPFYFGEVLGKSSETWHTDRRDWWMGFSPFSATQFAAARSEQGATSMLATRGLHHFFRRHNRGTDWLGVSLGCGLPHPCMQSFSVGRKSPLYSVIGRDPDGNPVSDASILHPSGVYRHDFAVGRRPGSWSKPSIWKAAREFAAPPVPLLENFSTTAFPGVHIHPPSIVATACESAPEGIRLRLLNLAGRKVQARIRIGHPEKVITVPMPPNGLREYVVR